MRVFNRNFPGVVRHKTRSAASTNIQPQQTAIRNTSGGRRTLEGNRASKGMERDISSKPSRILAKSLRQGWEGSKGFDTPLNRDSEARQNMTGSPIIAPDPALIR